MDPDLRINGGNMQEQKVWRMVFRAIKGYKQRTIRCTCTENELEEEKEKWAMLIEEETGMPVRCVEVCPYKPKGDD